MDVPRLNAARNRRIKRTIYAIVVVLLGSAITLGLSRLKPAAPEVDRATVWIDSVKRGPMLRQVRGLGTLVPEEVRWIPATREGLVERIHFRPGVTVKANTILIELSNPELLQQVVDAELQLRAAESDLANLRVQLQGQVLNQQAAQAVVESEFNQAKLRAEADEQLLKEGLIAELNMKLSKVRADELASRNEMEKKRVDTNRSSAEAQIAAQQARIEQFRALHELKRQQVEELRVRAGVDGVLQQLPVEVGQRVAPGTILAKVTEPGRLKAELKIAETQAKDIQVGQVASIDTRNGIVEGQVVRIDPAVLNGTVTVDVSLMGELPKGARPDLSVDGTVEIERLSDVLYVGRPAYGQSDSTIGIFKLSDDGEAHRIQVKLGRSSVNTIEIVTGLQVGDQVILSDMSAWDAFDRVRLNK